MHPIRGRVAVALLASLATTACTAVGIRSGTEQPAYEVVRILGEGVELRSYGPRLAVETTVPAGPGARNAAFRRLAGYIFGDNRDAREIAMTVPVATQAARSSGERIAVTAPLATSPVEGGLQMRFFLPADLTRDTAPIPNDAEVRLVDVPAETLAVRRFSGRPTPTRIDRETDRLLEMLGAAGQAPTGPPRALFYDPPWTVPGLRRNEVAVPIAPPHG